MKRWIKSIYNRVDVLLLSFHSIYTYKRVFLARIDQTDCTDRRNAWIKLFRYFRFLLP